MTRERFARSVSILCDIEDGYYNCDVWKTSFRDGFFMAFAMWRLQAYSRVPPRDYTDFDAQAGFRSAVSEFQDGIGTDMSDDWQAGYRQAVEIFRRAKGL